MWTRCDAGTAGRLLGLLLVLCGPWTAAKAEDAAPAPELHMVAVAHLDTQWRWTVRESIDPFLYNTLVENFRLFELYPDYLFNFEGAFRYALMKEYYPAEYERMRDYIRQGRWRVAGPAMDALDVIMPTPESILRSVLHAQRFYREEFDLEALDIFLPDCFGFPVTLPTLAAHSGLTGFSTQKLGWGSSVGIPFWIGVWEGIDGSRIPAVLHAGPYNWAVRRDVSEDEGILAQINTQIHYTGFPIGYRYYGVGDQGGAPDESTVAWVSRAMNQGAGPLAVRFAASDDIFSFYSAEAMQRLPNYQGELLMTRHATGSYTSYAPIKYWSRLNERMTLAAERAALAAQAFAGVELPQERLRDAWLRFSWHHQHDGITGTSIPEANDIMINDQVLAFNLLHDVLQESIAAWGSVLDTRGPGIPVLVYNPTPYDRRDLVEMDWPFADPDVSVLVWQGDQTVLAQKVEHAEGAPRLLFAAEVPATGMAVYHVVEQPAASQQGNWDVYATPDRLQVGSLRVSVNEHGQIASIRDVQSQREWLTQPIEWQFLPNSPARWVAWEIDYHELQSEPLHVLRDPVNIQVLEDGPLRARLRVDYEYEETRIRQDIVVMERDGMPWVTVDAELEWHSFSNLLKVAFPVHVQNPKALYDVGLGHVERGINREELYEVPAQEWAGIGERDGSAGLVVFSRDKYGWDRPQEHLLRHTLIHSPKDETTDFGTHRTEFTLLPQETDWSSDLHRRAEQLHMPLLAFATRPSGGQSAESDSFVRVNTPGVRLLAAKPEEDGDRVIVRLGEMDGIRRSRVEVEFPNSVIRSVCQVDGLENEIGPAAFDGNTVVFPLRRFGLAAFAVELEPAERSVPAAVQVSLSLPYDTVMTAHRQKRGRRDRIPVSQFPATVEMGRVSFEMAGAEAPAGQAVRARGQVLEWDLADASHVDVLVASLSGDRDTAWLVGEQIHVRSVPDLFEKQGYSEHYERPVPGARLAVRPGLVKRESVAWYATHRIDRAGDVVPYAFSYLFRIRLPVEPGAQSITLPNDRNVLVFAATVVSDPVAEAIPLHGWGERAYRGPVPLIALPRTIGLWVVAVILIVGAWLAWRHSRQLAA